VPGDGPLQAQHHEAAATKAPPADLFSIVWPHLESYLGEPHWARDVAAAFGLEPAQARAWPDRAAKQGLANVSGRPKVYLDAGRIQLMCCS
jgi:hypothetical protein